MRPSIGLVDGRQPGRRRRPRRRPAPPRAAPGPCAPRRQDARARPSRPGSRRGPPRALPPRSGRPPSSPAAFSSFAERSAETRVVRSSVSRSRCLASSDWRCSIRSANSARSRQTPSNDCSISSISWSTGRAAVAEQPSLEADVVELDWGDGHGGGLPSQKKLVNSRSITSLEQEQEEDGHHRREVERADRRQDPPEEPQVGLAHVSEELRETANPGRVGHPHPRRQHVGEDQQDVDVDEDVDEVVRP